MRIRLAASRSGSGCPSKPSSCLATKKQGGGSVEVPFIRGTFLKCLSRTTTMEPELCWIPLGKYIRKYVGWAKCCSNMFSSRRITRHFPSQGSQLVFSSFPKINTIITRWNILYMLNIPSCTIHMSSIPSYYNDDHDPSRLLWTRCSFPSHPVNRLNSPFHSTSFVLSSTSDVNTIPPHVMARQKRVPPAADYSCYHPIPHAHE